MEGRLKPIAFFMVVGLFASFLAGCGGGHGSVPDAPTSGPSANPSVPGGGYGGTADVGYVGFPDGAMVLPFGASPYKFVGIPVAAVPGNGAMVDQMALSADGTKIYGVASTPSLGPVIYAYAMSSSGETALGTQQIQTKTTLGSTFVAPLSNSSVAVITTPASGAAQLVAEYSSDLRTVEIQPSELTSAYSYAVPGASDDFYSLNEVTSTVARFLLPATAPTATSTSTIPISGPLQYAGGKVYATHYDATSDMTTLYSLDPTTLAETEVLQIGHKALLDGASAKALAILIINDGSLSLATYPLGGTTLTPIVPAPSLASGSVTGVTVSPDGTKLLLTATVNGAGLVDVIDAASGAEVSVALPGTSTLPQGTAIVGAPLSY